MYMWSLSLWLVWDPPPTPLAGWPPPGWATPLKVAHDEAGSLMESCLCHHGGPPGWLTPPPSGWLTIPPLANYPPRLAWERDGWLERSTFMLTKHTCFLFTHNFFSFFAIYGCLLHFEYFLNSGWIFFHSPPKKIQHHVPAEATHTHAHSCRFSKVRQNATKHSSFHPLLKIRFSRTCKKQHQGPGLQLEIPNHISCRKHTAGLSSNEKMASG